ncbi:hypothetical protein BTH_I0067 [Burkholderia thailandensis E264]|uniref:Uncharacterized protein n=1 Tax=Burkholderia thailandensis (strain ATCC 700388 / DSM 13276 / CCUG 48851 / CIP 106301 / E264) TaxID=271848 RepID=Q2T2K8_BURTA|nr:hypothetical protein BTH_I0067 [Burkholderia thailandensis E264]
MFFAFAFVPAIGLCAHRVRMSLPSRGASAVTAYAWRTP